MERPEFSGENRQPELDRHNLGSIFAFAREEQRRLKRITSEEQLSPAIEFLVEKLERFVTQNFTTLPDVSVRTRDVSRTTGVFRRESGEYSIKSEPLPLDSTDAEVFGEHRLRRTLYGFYKAEDDSLRVYIESDEEPISMPGGVYTPLLSVAIEEADISLATQETNKQLREITAYINQALVEYNRPVKDLVVLLSAVLDNAGQTTAKKLQVSSTILGEIAHHATLASNIEDALLSVIHMKLDLEVPQTISTSRHNLPFTEHPKPAFIPKGAAVFENVMPQIELVGETDHRELGLFFLDETQRAIQIPVRYITDIRRN